MFSRLLLPVLVAALLALAGCQKDKAPSPQGGGLIGTWQLTGHQCYCIPTPLPNEQVRFDAATFTFLRDGHKTLSGTYSATVAAASCGGTAGPGLRFQPDSAATRVALFTLDGDTLTLDYGGPCDAPVDTYQRIAL